MVDLRIAHAQGSCQWLSMGSEYSANLGFQSSYGETKAVMGTGSTGVAEIG
jgi:hypothetical protein